MTVIQSVGALADIQPSWWPLNSYGSMQMYDRYHYDYATLYRTQPNVRVCVEFLARNIAQLGLHVFRRVSDTDRERLADHPLAQVLAKPLPPEFKVTRYRLIEHLVGDLGVYFNAYWLKVRRDDLPAGLLRIPPPYIEVEGGLVPTGYKINLIGADPMAVNVSEIVHFRGYNAESAITGLSPLETLRRILAEEHAAGDYREHFWRNAARMGGIIERPAGAPEWSETARARFKAEFEALYSGGDNSGKTAILEEGMTWRAGTFNPQESEYLAGRKLTREECARAYHIPLPMVGILDHATFSNIKEQHKNLYQDSLGPWLALIEQDIELQLLPEFGDTDRVYCEFNIAEKLAGAFEDQVQALQAAVGRPWMTANEARARMNLPSMGGDAERLVTPLNVIVGGQASPRDSAPTSGTASKAKVAGLNSHMPEMQRAHEEKWTEVLSRHYRRQEAAIMPRIPEGPGKADIGGVWFDEERWNRELTEDLFRLNVFTAEAWAGTIGERIEGKALVDEGRMLPWLEEHSRVQAEYINSQMRDELETALRDPEPREAASSVFVAAVSTWALRQAISAVLSASNFGAHEAARAGGLRSKTWRVNSSNPRHDHLVMDGETVGIRERFSNGMRWPGDPAGGAEQVANCQCSVEFGR